MNLKSTQSDTGGASPIWLRVFKVGRHKDNSGQELVVTRADLDTIAERSKARMAQRKVPGCVGHPELDSPSYAWFDDVKREGDDLLARMCQVSRKFAEAVNEGLYKHLSVALREDMSIRHVGFLGGQAPAIDLGELPRFAFSEDLSSVRTFEFSEYRLSRLGRMWQALREYILKKDGQEEADRTVPQWEIDMLKEEPSHAFSEPSTPIQEIPMTTKTPEQLATENEALRQQVTQLTTAQAQTEGRVSQLTFAQAREQDKAYLQGMPTRIMPAMIPGLLDCMAIMREKGKFTFAEGGEKPAIEAFKSLLEKLPEQMSFSEQASKDRAAGTDADAAGPASKRLTELTEEKMGKDTSLSYAAASKLVFAEHPDLVKTYNQELQNQG